MWFRSKNKSKNSSSLEHVIERYRRQRATRFVVGVSFDQAYQNVVGAVTSFRGAGKWMRPEYVDSMQFELPSHLFDACKQARTGKTTVADSTALGYDLGESAAAAVEALLGKAGIAIENILTVCVNEPGLEWEEYDGRKEHASLFQPQRFVERTGMNVIDALPMADIAAGGSGSPLDALVYWLIFADRSRPVANRHRWLLLLDDQTKCFQLPPSDGLDSDLPDIQLDILPGLQIVNQLVQANSNETNDYRGLLAVQGKSIDPFRHQTNEHFAAQLNPHLKLDQRAQSAAISNWQSETIEQLHALSKQQPFAWEDIWFIASVLVSDSIQSLVTIKSQLHQKRMKLAEDSDSEDRESEDGESENDKKENAKTETDFPIDLILASLGSKHGLIQAELANSFGKDSVVSVDQDFCPADALDAVVAATLGMMHIDQLPASLPWLTGCSIPRLHGRITPGRPAHWRNLINEMADYHPPAMKLREAV